MLVLKVCCAVGDLVVSVLSPGSDGFVDGKVGQPLQHVRHEFGSDCHCYGVEHVARRNPVSVRNISYSQCIEDVNLMLRGPLPSEVGGHH